MLLVPWYTQLPLTCLNCILLADTVSKIVVFEGFFFLGFLFSALKSENIAE